MSWQVIRLFQKNIFCRALCNKFVLTWISDSHHPVAGARVVGAQVPGERVEVRELPRVQDHAQHHRARVQRTRAPRPPHQRRDRAHYTTNQYMLCFVSNKYIGSQLYSIVQQNKNILLIYFSQIRQESMENGTIWFSGVVNFLSYS